MKRDYNKALEITALYEISKLLGSSLNLKSNLRGVMRGIVRISGYEKRGLLRSEATPKCPLLLLTE